MHIAGLWVLQPPNARVWACKPLAYEYPNIITGGSGELHMQECKGKASRSIILIGMWGHVMV